MQHQVIHLNTIIGNGYLIPRIPGDTIEAVLDRFFKAAQAGDEVAERALMSCSSMAVDANIGHRSGAHLFLEGQTLVIQPAHYPGKFKKGGGLKYLQSQKNNLAARMQMTYIMRLRMEIPNLIVY